MEIDEFYKGGIFDFFLTLESDHMCSGLCKP